MRRKKRYIFFCGGPTKKIIQWVKNMPNFIYFFVHWIKNYVDPTHLRRRK